MKGRPEQIIFASNNVLRKEALSSSSTFAQVLVCCGGPEALYASPQDVAAGKMSAAYRRFNGEEMPGLESQMKRNETVLVGVDVNNGLHGENWIKPEEEPDGRRAIIRHLMMMAQAGHYEIRGGTAVRNGVAVLGGETVVVGLTDFARRALKFPSESFMQEYYEVMGRLNHHPDGRALAMKISGGIDLLTLVAMGMVDSINGIRLDVAGSDEVLFEALRVALISIDPRVLNEVSRGWGDNLESVAQGLLGSFVAEAREERPHKYQLAA